MSRCGWRPHIESALALSVRDISELIQDGRCRAGAWHWTSNHGGERGSVSFSFTPCNGIDAGTLTLNYSHADRDTGKRKNVECIIRLCSMPLNYGGRRWYMLCPYTHRRALKLYKFAGIEQFCCRTAIRPLPTYASQRTSGSERVMAQRWAIRRKMGDNISDLFGQPCKPKGMRWRTFQRYANRDATLADRENDYLLRLIGRLQGKSLLSL